MESKVKYKKPKPPPFYFFLNMEEFRLTEREVEILGFLVKGMSYKMIAEKCFVSLPTISTHIRHIYEKLQVHSGTEAVAKAIEHNIVKK